LEEGIQYTKVSVSIYLISNCTNTGFMARPRLTAEQRRLQILENASKVFAAQGLTGTRTKDIAKACDINEAVLYHHFESKDDLFRESFHFIQKDLLEELEKIAKQAPDGFTALKDTMQKLFNGLVTQPEMRAYLLHGFSSMTQGEEMFDWVKKWCTGQDNFIKGLLKRGLDDGSIKPDICENCTTWHIKGVMWSAIMASMLQMNKESLRHISTNLLNRVINELSTSDVLEFADCSEDQSLWFKF